MAWPQNRGVSVCGGVRGFLGAMTVEGVPNWGGNPMGLREYIYDTKNMRGIAV